MLRLQAALQLVGQSADGPFQRFKLLVKIGAQTLQLSGFSQFFGANHFIMAVQIDQIIGVGVRDRLRGRGLHWGVALGHIRLFAQLLIGHIIHRDLRL